MMRHLRIPLTGIHHLGADDVVNITKLWRRLFCDGADRLPLIDFVNHSGKVTSYVRNSRPIQTERRVATLTAKKIDQEIRKQHQKLKAQKKADKLARRQVRLSERKQA